MLTRSQLCLFLCRPNPPPPDLFIGNTEAISGLWASTSFLDVDNFQITSVMSHNSYYSIGQRGEFLSYALSLANNNCFNKSGEINYPFFGRLITPASGTGGYLAQAFSYELAGDTGPETLSYTSDKWNIERIGNQLVWRWIERLAGNQVVPSLLDPGALDREDPEVTNFTEQDIPVCE